MRRVRSTSAPERWTEDVRDAYADRITARLGRHIQNLERATLARVVVSPADVAALNVNLVGGDIYGGSCALDQNFLFRPLPQAPGHRTAVDASLAHRRRRPTPAPGWAQARATSSTRSSRSRRCSAALLVASPGPAPMKLSLSEISTVGATFAEDVAAYAAAGFDGDRNLGDEAPRGRRRRTSRSFAGRASGSRTAFRPFRRSCPSRLPGMEGPPNPAERVDALCASVRRLARYEPECVLCLTGPVGDLAPDEARAIVIDGAAGGRRGCGREWRSVRSRARPPRRSTRSVSFVNTIADTIALLDEAELPQVGIMLDTYNLWHEPPEAFALVAPRATGLHVADEPPDLTRSDRVLPGEGGSRSAEQIAALRGAGWDGYLDVEIFSTPDRFWGLAPEDAARRAFEAVSRL